jgi:hypothetical protein
MSISPEDKSHMYNIAYGGMMRPATPDDVAERLIAAGHVRACTGGLILTDAGHVALGKSTNYIEIGKK